MAAIGEGNGWPGCFYGAAGVTVDARAAHVRLTVMAMCWNRQSNARGGNRMDVRLDVLGRNMAANKREGRVGFSARPQTASSAVLFFRMGTHRLQSMCSKIMCNRSFSLHRDSAHQPSHVRCRQFQRKAIRTDLHNADKSCIDGHLITSFNRTMFGCLSFLRDWISRRAIHSSQL
jgi:hypothetical protein